MNNLESLYLLKNGARKRVSSYDRTGGNDDRIYIKPNEKAVIFDVHTSGIINHIWMTQMNFGDIIEDNAFRKVYLKFFWDDCEFPSVLVPLGDFFGMGHGKCHNFTSAPLQMSPEDGRALNCYFPMPFKKAARIEVVNECDTTLMLYFYIDYTEQKVDDNSLYFGAYWHRENPCKGRPIEEFKDRKEYLFGGKNVDGKDNYVILELEGQGHYVGCNYNITNLSKTEEWDWPGEGDDMIFIDDDPTNTLYGTGSEDYFSTAWCPTQEYNSLYHGIILGGKPNWKGEITYYRYHILDPIMFNKHIKVTIEHGHANHRSDDVSSTAYFYTIKPYQHKEALMDVAHRLAYRDKENTEK